MQSLAGRVLVALSAMLGWTGVTAATAQPLLEGYVEEGTELRFVFDPAAYMEGAPTRVSVTGPFRGWSTDMDDADWLLQPAADGTWVLAIDNADFRLLSPRSPFKFRVNGGIWLDPPPQAPNAEGGNLLYRHDTIVASLKAEIRGPSAVWATVSGMTRPIDTASYRLLNASGNELPIARIIPNTASETLIVPAIPLDPARVHYLEIPGAGLRALCRRDPWFRTLYSDKALGATVSDDHRETTFRVFAPRAHDVRLYLYHGADDSPEEAAATLRMTRDPNGVWEIAQAGDHHGIYYDFTVHGPRDPGNFFFETHPVHISDPYARVSDDSFGKSRVWRSISPPSPVVGGRPAMDDVVAYEVHVQDFTDLLPVEPRLRGTLAGMATGALRNSLGEPVGIDYLDSLGINVVHLMPVQEFLHYPDDAWAASFGSDPFAIEMGIAQKNYQWGYRTTHAFAVESRFRTPGTEIGAEREQFRDLVQAFHNRGISVVIDVVPNHTGENMDARHLLLNFNALDLPYYYRTDELLQHIGPFGNEVKTEDRPMTQRWVVDQLKHFVEEFGVDGFRIDLAGQIDQQTLLRVKAELPPDLLIYGEPWIAISDPAAAANPDWAWYKEDAPITFFQDTARDAFKGSPLGDVSDRGFAGGNGALRIAAMAGLANHYSEEASGPDRGINYLDIHDNWALADRFALIENNGLKGVDEAAVRIAATLLMTSMGPVVINGGTEMLRSKGLATEEEFVREGPGGPIYFKGRDDTYNLRAPNQFIWETVGRTDDVTDFAGMIAWWKGLIALRLGEHGAVFRNPGPVPPGHFEWILPVEEEWLGYVAGGEVLVLLNVGSDAATFSNVLLPEGSWQLVAAGSHIDLQGLEGPEARLTGRAAHVLSLPAQSVKIWVRE